MKNFTVEDGLSVNSVNRILQDDDGYLWFSTLDGLIRYDGYDFYVFNSGNTKGMVSNRIAGMIKTRENEIWMILAEGMIMRKAGSTFTTFAEAFGDFKGNALRIIEANNGEIWIATTQGIAVFNRETQSFESPDEQLLQENTWTLGSPDSGGIFVINENGLVLWKNNRASLLLENELSPFPFKDILQVIEFSPGEIWLLGGDGIFRFSISGSTIDNVHYQQEEQFAAWNLHSDPDGTYILNSSTGFYSLNPQTEELIKLQPEFKTSIERINLVFRGAAGEEIRLGDKQVIIDGKRVLQSDGIQSGFIDSEGSLWISTIRNGVFQIRRSDFLNITSSQIQGFENIYPVIESSDGSKWAGSFSNGIYRIKEESTENWNMDNSNLTANICRFLFEDADSKLYAGMWRDGLWEYSHNNWEEVEPFSDLVGDDITVEAMHRDRAGRLLIGNSERMVVRENEAYRFFDDTDTLAFHSVRVIREDKDSTLFFGTNGNGFTRLKDGSFQHFLNTNSGLTSNFIRDIFIQSEDTLWVGTENLGLNRVVFKRDDTISVKSVTEQDGLIKNSINRIIETPDHHLWISTNGGIMRISLDELNHYADGEINSLSLLGFNERNGMINREANGGVQTAGLLTQDQKLWFPNQKGITIIDPLKIAQENSLPNPKPVIEQIALADTTLFIENQTNVEVDADDRNLRIKFSAPNFSTPDRIHFRYKLQGVNTDWENGDLSREAVFTNIPPGIHTFQVMAYRLERSTDAAHASILINVPYYFYETPWFYALTGLFGFLLIFGGVKYRTRILRQREQKLQARVDQQTIALKEAADQKSRFFSGITHELKTPLSLILGPLDDFAENPKPDNWSTVQNRISMMQRNGVQLKNLVDQILDVTKLNSDAIKLTLRPVHFTELTRKIIGQFYSKLEQEGIKLVFESGSVDETIYVDTDAWERIVINLISNAIRFSPKDSTIQVKISSGENQVFFSLKDEGIGIDKKDADKIFEYLYQAEGANAAGGTGIGLYLVKGLVERMKGTIQVNSKKGEGAEFCVLLRKGFDHFEKSDTIIHEPFVLTEPEIKTHKTERNETSRQFKNNRAQKILVVEDNADFREYLQSTLSQHYEVNVAADGSEALTKLKKLDPDLVISDVMMPGMNGLEFVSNLRKEDTYKHLPVIFLSAKSTEIDMERGLSTGADIYLTKPIQNKLLLSQVAAVLRREKILQSGKLSEIEKSESELEKNIREIVYRQLGNPSLNINMLSETLFMSRTTLYKKWGEISDISLNDFIKKVRLKEAKILLNEKNFNVQEAAAAVGYADANYFSTSFKKEFGVSPSEVIS